MVNVVTLIPLSDNNALKQTCMFAIILSQPFKQTLTF